VDRAGSSGRGAVVDDNILLDSPCTGETSTGEVHGQRHTHDMACMHGCSTLSVIVVVVVVVVVFVIGARTTPGWTSRLTIQPVQASCHYPLWQTPHTFSFLSPSRSSPILVLPARFNTHTGPLCALLDEPRNPNPNPDPLRTDGPGSRRCAIPSTDEPARPIPRETRSGLQDASRGEAVQGGSWVESSRIFTKMDVQLQYTDAVSSLDK
jgi:hypothetical protein